MAVEHLTSEKRIVTTRRSAVSFRREAEASPELFICRYFLRFLLETHLVYIAPHPLLTGLKRFDDWVSGGFKVLRCVLILGIITAPHVPAGQA